MKAFLKIKKSVLVTAILLVGPSAFAGPGQLQRNVELLCNGERSLERCADKIEEALAEIGCKVDTSYTECEYGLLQDPNSSNSGARIQSRVPVCQTYSTNCSSPIAGAWSESCDSTKKMVKISKKRNIDAGHGYGIGSRIFGYSRNICIKK